MRRISCVTSPRSPSPRLARLRTASTISPVAATPTSAMISSSSSASSVSTSISRVRCLRRIDALDERLELLRELLRRPLQSLLQLVEQTHLLRIVPLADSRIAGSRAPHAAGCAAYRAAGRSAEGLREHIPAERRPVRCEASASRRAGGARILGGWPYPSASVVVPSAPAPRCVDRSGRPGRRPSARRWAVPLHTARRARARRASCGRLQRPSSCSRGSQRRDRPRASSVPT